LLEGNFIYPKNSIEIAMPPVYSLSSSTHIGDAELEATSTEAAGFVAA
jgi:hypothetical protein